MMLVNVKELIAPSGELLNFEIVGGKGLGNTDAIYDALTEELGLATARRSLERSGRNLHQNVDKALLWEDAAPPIFGGGEIDTLKTFPNSTNRLDIWAAIAPGVARVLDTVRRSQREALA